MNGTWPRATSPATHEMIDLAHQHGIRVWWRDLADGRRGHWSAKHRAVWLSPDLTDREARSLLAHELAHAHYEDSGPQPPHLEARAWRAAAALLIDPAAYIVAERIHEGDLAAIADDLDVTLEVIHGYHALITLERSA